MMKLEHFCCLSPEDLQKSLNEFLRCNSIYEVQHYIFEQQLENGKETLFCAWVYFQDYER